VRAAALTRLQTATIPATHCLAISQTSNCRRLACRVPKRCQSKRAPQAGLSSFGRGWLLIGEVRPEILSIDYEWRALIFATSIVPPLKGMVALATVAREAGRRYRFGGGYDAAPVPLLAQTSAPQVGGRGSRGQAISLCALTVQHRAAQPLRLV